MRDVYRYRGIRDRRIWQDRSTLGIPTQYQFMFVQLADVAMIDGQPMEDVAELADEADRMRITALGGQRYLEAP